MLSLRGIAARDRATYVSRPETELDGIRAVIRQGDLVPQVIELMGLRQEGCTPSTTACDPVTHLTVSMPVAIDPDYRSAILINDRGRELLPIPVRVVHDRIHVLNGCDTAGIFIGLGTGLQGRCEPMVTDGSGKLITRENPARPGQTLVAWAFGLGVPGPNVQAEGFEFPGVRTPPELHFEFRQNAAGRRSIGENGTRPVFAAQRAPWGLYQMNFVVPPVPQDSSLPACDDRTVFSNLTVTFAGLTSQDSVRLCVAR